MPRVQAGEVQLGWRQWGQGDVTVVFIHGNLASKDWIELAAPSSSAISRPIQLAASSPRG